MMKQQPYAIKRKPSKLCKVLLTLMGFKFCLLGMLLFEPVFPNLGVWLPDATRLTSAWQAAKTAFIGEATVSVVSAAPVVPQSQVFVPASISRHASVAYAAETAANDASTVAVGNGGPGKGEDTGRMREALNRKQEDLARKEQDLKALEVELNDRLQQLQALENRLQVMLKDAEELKDDKFRHLVDVLSNMKARQAAEVLSSLDEGIAVRILAGMRGRQAGEILTYADPAKAARLSEALARMQLPFE